MPIPVIGVTTYHGLSKQGHPAVFLLRAYVKALIQAGGAPVLIPSDLTEEGWRFLYGRLDGILFTGGGDVAVEHFRGKSHPRVNGVDPARDNLEIPLVQTVSRDGKPFLGICRGFQVVNVAMGGTLYTHIEDQKPGALKHDYFPDWPRDYLAHEVSITAGTRLAEIIEDPALMVNSLHHQGAKDIAPALRPVAHAPDGLVEALELPGHPFGIAVQWHPEWLTEQASTRRLFRVFVEASSHC